LIKLGKLPKHCSLKQIGRRLQRVGRVEIGEELLAVRVPVERQGKPAGKKRTANMPGGLGAGQDRRIRPLFSRRAAACRLDGVAQIERSPDDRHTLAPIGKRSSYRNAAVPATRAFYSRSNTLL
jgi:hypothetical protein